MSGGDGPSGAWEGCARAFCGGESCPHPFCEFAALGTGNGRGRRMRARPAGSAPEISFFLDGFGLGEDAPRPREDPLSGGRGKTVPPSALWKLPFRKGGLWLGCFAAPSHEINAPRRAQKKSPVPGGNGGFLLDLCRAQNSSPQRRKPPQASRPTKMVMTTR